MAFISSTFWIKTVAMLIGLCGLQYSTSSSTSSNAANGLVFSPTFLLQDQIGNGNHFTGTSYLGAMASSAA